jgi:hypothetical protein
VVLVFTNVMMPVLINARVDSLAFLPLLFKGEHEDFDSRWYDSVGDSLMLTAAIKIVVWPLRWPLLHLATRVRARLLSASAATQVSFIVGSCEMGDLESIRCDHTGNPSVRKESPSGGTAANTPMGFGSFRLGRATRTAEMRKATACGECIRRS